MGLIKVRATEVGFNGGPSARLKSIWAFGGKRELCIADEDRGLKNIGDVFMVEESKFTPAWQERVDPLPPAPVVEKPAEVVVEPKKAGRPRKTV